VLAKLLTMWQNLFYSWLWEDRDAHAHK